MESVNKIYNRTTNLWNQLHTIRWISEHIRRATFKKRNHTILKCQQLIGDCYDVGEGDHRHLDKRMLTPCIIKKMSYLMKTTKYVK